MSGMNELAAALAIRSSLEHRKPFSAIRLGDGEGRVLLWPGAISREMMDKHLMFWFGHTEISDAQLNTIKGLLLRAAWNANVVGFYQGADRSKFWRAPQKLVAIKEETLICGNDLHRVLWDQGLLGLLMTQAETLVMVTCRDIQLQRHDYLTIQIPEEAHTSGQRNDHFERFPEIRHQIWTASRPGVLVLVGAGVLGKIYCDVAKEAGAVAVDIGSIFDGLAGVESRSYLTKQLISGTMIGETGRTRAPEHSS